MEGSVAHVRRQWRRDGEHTHGHAAMDEAGRLGVVEADYPAEIATLTQSSA